MLAELRLKHLFSDVDEFIVVESKVTHSGEAKGILILGAGLEELSAISEQGAHLYHHMLSRGLLFTLLQLCLHMCIVRIHLFQIRVILWQRVKCFRAQCASEHA